MHEIFKKTDLKDGMVLTLRCGVTRLFFNGELFGVTQKEIVTMSHINDFDDNLNFHSQRTECDIVKVEYMEETIWERKMTFDEARKSGKKFRYNGWFGFYDLKGVLKELSLKNDRVASEMLDKREWEVKW